MAGEIKAAVLRYHDRLQAVSQGDAFTDEEAARRALRASLSGFDLDWSEFEEWAAHHELMAGFAILARANAVDALLILGHSQEEVVHARARAFDGHPVEDILSGLCGDERVAA